MSDDGGGEDDGDGDEDDQDGGAEDAGPEEIPLAEKAAMATSALFTVSLFAFATWQALGGAGAVAPTVHATGHHSAPDGDVVYTVELRNPGDVGLLQVTVEAGCADPPIRLVFENVPSGGRRAGSVVCPPGTTDPRISIDSWVHE